MAMALRNDRPIRTRNEAVIALAGRPFVADASGALWCERTSTLVVSDLHLEKGSSLARRGMLLPPYDTAETLERLRRVVDFYAPRRIVSLGDSFHDDGGYIRMADRDLCTLSALQHGRDWIWVSGNHDAGIGKAVPGEHVGDLVEAGLRFVHVPGDAGDAAEIAGHLHPCVKIRARIRNLRRKAFVFDQDRLVMPAFGAFTGGLNICDPAIAGLFPRSRSVFVLGTDRVYSALDTDCWPD